MSREVKMDKIYVVYWSQSGNTQAMAEAVGRRKCIEWRGDDLP